MSITNFHWGLHAWACYAIGALVLAYFKFKRGTNFQPGAPIRNVFKGGWVEPVARFADFTAVIAVAFGVCGSMAMASLQFQTGLGVVSGADTSGIPVRAAILGVLFVCYTISASTSLDKGIKILSQTNIMLAIGLVCFLLFSGPTMDLLGGIARAAGDYLMALPGLSVDTYPAAKKGWFHGWTIIYFIWWIAWTPFVGIFIARISRGRTIRQFLAGVVLAPTAFTIVWFAIFGGVGLVEDASSGGAIAAAVKQDFTVALFHLFERLPGTTMLGALALVLVFVFLVTSVDSATYVLGMLTSRGVPDPSTLRKLSWGVALALLGGALLFIGNVDLIKALSTIGAIPFVPILLLQIGALLIALRRDRAG
jgi:glycine betaine transporter